MISLAIIGLMQALFIPGFLVSSAISKYTKLPLADNLLIATPLSIVLNYWLVLILESMHAYTRPAMLLTIVGELIVLLVVLGRHLSLNIPHGTFSWQSNNIMPPNGRYSATLFNVLALGALITIYHLTAGSVFEAWDAVVSWNRWAKEWFDQNLGGTYGYPPGVPILYSLVYKLAGTTNLQTISKLVAAYFPFFGLLCFWRLGNLRGQLALASSIAGVIFVYLLAVGVDVLFVFSGYVDPVMAALGAFVLYALHISAECAKSGLTSKERRFVIALITIAVSGIAMIKQSGVPVALLFALMTMYLSRRTLAEEKGHWIGLALIFGFLVANYYVYAYFYWDDYVRADSLIKGPVFLRPYTGFLMLLAATGAWLWILIAGAIIFDRLSRGIFLLLVVPLYLFWAFLVSYDLRTAFVFFPWLALLAGIALAKIVDMGKLMLLVSLIILCLIIGLGLFPGNVANIEWLFKIKNIEWLFNAANIKWLLFTTAGLYLLYLVGRLLYTSSMTKFQNCSMRCGFCLMGTIAFILIVLPFIKSADSLLAENTIKRIRSNDQGFNEKLSKIFEQEPAARMISCWQTIYNIPSLEGRFIPVGDCSMRLASRWIASPDIEYLLQWSPSGYPSVAKPQETRELLTSRGIGFTEEKLSEEHILFKKKRGYV